MANPNGGANTTHNALADADLRAAMLGELFEDLLKQQRPNAFRVRLACVAGQELLEELTTLYREAAQGKAPP